MTPREIARQVEQRAGGRCEYCRMHQSLQGATFHVEHIVPRSLGGPSDIENLAWACPGCNLHKSNRIDVLCMESGTAIPLFNPRRHKWSEHFHWASYQIIGLTPVGRVTVEALALNNERRIRIRQAEARFDLFPPRDTVQRG